MDDKFDKILDSLRQQNPTDLQMQKWRNAVQKVSQPQEKSSTLYWTQMVAAVFVGVVIGGLLFGDLDNEKNKEIAYEDATIEVVYTKL